MQGGIDIAERVGGGDGVAGAFVVEENLLLPGEKAQRENIVGCDALGQSSLQIG